MKTRTKVLIGIAILLVLIIVGFLGAQIDTWMKAPKAPKTIKVPVSYLDSLKRASADWKQKLIDCNTAESGNLDSIARLNREKDSIKNLLDKCKGIKKKPAAKKIVPMKKAVTAVMKPNVSADLVSPNAFKPATGGFKASSTYKTSLDGIRVIGLKDGDFYITISPDNYLQYCFAKKLYDEAGGTSTPELNGKNSGKKFTLDGDMYVYVDKSAPVTTATLSRTINWTIYIGPKDGYDAYIPHEIIKPQISQARKELAGTISQEDVDKIGALVPEVKAGRILPNKITAIGDYDGLKYEGWHFRTQILYKQQ